MKCSRHQPARVGQRLLTLPALGVSAAVASRRLSSPGWSMANTSRDRRQRLQTANKRSRGRWAPRPARAEPRQGGRNSRRDGGRLPGPTRHAYMPGNCTPRGSRAGGELRRVPAARRGRTPCAREVQVGRGCGVSGRREREAENGHPGTAGREKAPRKRGSPARGRQRLGCARGGRWRRSPRRGPRGAAPDSAGAGVARGSRGRDLPPRPGLRSSPRSPSIQDNGDLLLRAPGASSLNISCLLPPSKYLPRCFCSVLPPSPVTRLPPPLLRHAPSPARGDCPWSRVGRGPRGPDRRRRSPSP
uniref:Uncharacterized protein n=1 Tax=Rangifer tarandus platyrhynchus TaxID=3082113 RepID=A0ACB0F5B0_RANTA|nr:unnamed protein product [Rangifer tarandus platyrhynchus]